MDQIQKHEIQQKFCVSCHAGRSPVSACVTDCPCGNFAQECVI